jgi:hypothetical protein
MRGILGAILAAVLCLTWGGAARADSIDGDWCYKDGRRFTIDGSNFTTPGRNKIQGEYERYAYSYVIPKSEAGAGLTVSMVFIHDDELHVTLGKPEGVPMKGVSPGGPAEVWKRCRGGIT